MRLGFTGLVALAATASILSFSARAEEEEVLNV
jgi:putrescine transport system substrate-binding protein